MPCRPRQCPWPRPRLPKEPGEQQVGRCAMGHEQNVGPRLVLLGAAGVAIQASEVGGRPAPRARDGPRIWNDVRRRSWLVVRFRRNGERRGHDRAAVTAHHVAFARANMKRHALTEWADWLPASAAGRRTAPRCRRSPAPFLLSLAGPLTRGAERHSRARHNLGAAPPSSAASLLVRANSNSNAL